MRALPTADQALGPYEILLILGPIVGVGLLLTLSAALGSRLAFAIGAMVLPFAPAVALYAMFASLEDSIREESSTWVPLRASTRRGILASWCAVVIGVLALAVLESIVTPTFPILPMAAIAGVAGASIPVILWTDGGRRRALAQGAREETSQRECFVNENAGSMWTFAGLFWFATFLVLTWPIGVAAGLRGFVAPSDMEGIVLFAIYGVLFGFFAWAFTMAALLGSEIRPSVVGFRILNPNGLWPMTLEINPNLVARCFETTVGPYGSGVIRVEFHDATHVDFAASTLEKYENSNGLSFRVWMTTTLGLAENSISLVRGR